MGEGRFDTGSRPSEVTGLDTAQWAKLFESGFPKIFDKFKIFDKSHETLNLFTLITLQPQVSDKKGMNFYNCGMMAVLLRPRLDWSYIIESILLP